MASNTDDHPSTYLSLQLPCHSSSIHLLPWQVPPSILPGNPFLCPEHPHPFLPCIIQLLPFQLYSQLPLSPMCPSVKLSSSPNESLTGYIGYCSQTSWWASVQHWGGREGRPRPHLQEVTPPGHPGSDTESSLWSQPLSASGTTPSPHKAKPPPQSLLSSPSIRIFLVPFHFTPGLVWVSWPGPF